MDVTTPVDRLRQELDLLTEYLETAKQLDSTFLKLHARLVLAHVWDIASELEELPEAA
ncbi:MAG TPA: hypothetical protein VG944_02845 [Fimbriimonas sp.]|nr:hypothetical protein [Fimbriimonas sp.]